jgi:hypothetical protein
MAKGTLDTHVYSVLAKKSREQNELLTALQRKLVPE